jgi:hypothetical protein
MFSKQDKNILSVYIVAIVVVIGLVFVIINFNDWFFSDDLSLESQFTPATRNTIGTDEFSSDIFNDATFRSLGPLLSAEEIKKMEEQDSQTVDENGVPIIIVKPRPERKVRYSNPFKPF